MFFTHLVRSESIAYESQPARDDWNLCSIAISSTKMYVGTWIYIQTKIVFGHLNCIPSQHFSQGWWSRRQEDMYPTKPYFCHAAISALIFWGRLSDRELWWNFPATWSGKGGLFTLVTIDGMGVLLSGPQHLEKWIYWHPQNIMLHFNCWKITVPLFTFWSYLVL